MPGKADLAIYQGDDYTGLVQVYDGNSTKPADLTGYSARAQIRFGPADQYPQLLILIITSVDEKAGTVSLTIPANQTTTLISSNYSWDLELIQPDGGVQTVLTGKVVVTREVTRAVGVAPCNQSQLS